MHRRFNPIQESLQANYYKNAVKNKITLIQVGSKFQLCYKMYDPGAADGHADVEQGAEKWGCVILSAGSQNPLFCLWLYSFLSGFEIVLYGVSQAKMCSTNKVPKRLRHSALVWLYKEPFIAVRTSSVLSDKGNKLGLMYSTKKRPQKHLSLRNLAN